MASRYAKPRRRAAGLYARKPHQDYFATCSREADGAEHVRQDVARQLSRAGHSGCHYGRDTARRSHVLAHLERANAIRLGAAAAVARLHLKVKPQHAAIYVENLVAAAERSKTEVG